MNVTIQISDATYASLLNGTRRIEGSIGLVSPTEGNFNEYRRRRDNPDIKWIRLPHGRVSVNDESVRLNLCISRDEWVDASEAILDESEQASDFVNEMVDNL